MVGPTVNLISGTHIMWWDPPFMLEGDYAFICSPELLNNHSSPTYSEMRYFPPPHDPQINVITKRFELNKKKKKKTKKRI